MMFVSLGIGTFVAVALIVVVSILTGGKVTSANSQPVNAMVGKSVKAFTLRGLNGGTVKSPWSSGHASVLVVVVTVAQRCPCTSAPDAASRSAQLSEIAGRDWRVETGVASARRRALV